MSDMRLIVAGAGGRMGRNLVRAVTEADGVTVVGAVEAKGSAVIGRDATIPLVARKGRASYLGERSAGHLDPGAASATMLLDALVEVVAG